MTTAARPTFDTARGGSGARERDLSAMTKQYSSRDLPSHTSIKSRDRGQNAPEDLTHKDFRRELEERERVANISKERERGRGRLADKDKDEIEKTTTSKRLKLEPQNLDADDPLDDSDAGDSDSDSDDDETAALMAELQKIKREKAVEEREKEEKR